MSTIGFHCDWPFVVTRVKGKTPREEFEGYLRAMESQVLETGRPFGNMIVVEGEKGYGREARIRHIEWQRAHREALTTQCAATAIVQPSVSSFMRFALSTLLAVMGDAATPTKLFSSEAEARAWLQQMLEKKAA